MGVTLFDQKTNEVLFDVNFWHWRAIVEAVRSLSVLSEEKVDTLHQPFVGELGEADARAVAAALKERLIPTIGDSERLLLNDQMQMSPESTTEPDDGTFYRDAAEQHKNYSTNRDVIRRFADCCETCGGFRVS